MYPRTIIFLFLLVHTGTLPAQGDSWGLMPVAGRLPGTLQAYYDSLLQTASLPVNGKLQTERVSEGRGHPYFGDSDWAAGILNMKGKQVGYNKIRYDLLHDGVLILHFSASGSQVIRTPRGLVSAFDLQGHRFIWLDQGAGPGLVHLPGYYEPIYRNGPELWVRREKYLQERNSGSSAYRSERIIYLKNNGEYHRVTGRRSILKAMHDRAPEMKAYLNQNRIAWRDAGPEQWKTLMDHYVNLEH
ncbi:MAG: hypothetical protein V2B15_18160 [Bacteroidota bacterium]